jgi:hypothetical protein
MAGSRTPVRIGHQSLVQDFWNTSHLPATNVVATITKASAGAGKRNVCTALTVVLAALATAPTAVTLSCSLIDGAAGGTTYLWRAAFSLAAVGGAMNGIALTGLWLPGSFATGMTLEFSAAAGANTIESVWLSGIIIEGG